MNSSTAMDYQQPQARVLVFTRAPVQGKVKTRLIPALGAEGATTLYRYLLERLLARLNESRLAPLEIWATDPQHTFFDRFRRSSHVLIEAQRGTDLGERLFYAFDAALTRAPYAVIIGSDIPELAVDDIAEAIDVLQSGQHAAFMPAEDGGYGLVALRALDRRLFEGIDWGGPQVMEQTRGRLRQLGWSWHELPPCWDLDRAEDLPRLKQLPDLPQAIRTLLETHT